MPWMISNKKLHNLESMARALQSGWQWYHETCPDKPWKGPDLPSHHHSRVMCDNAIITVVGNGNTAMFWSDRWLFGGRIQALAPTIFSQVRPRARKQWTVAQALLNNSWVNDIQGGLSMRGFLEFLCLWDQISNVELTQDEDQHIWKLETSGQFSTKSTYRAFFYGAIGFEPWKRL